MSNAASNAAPRRHLGCISRGRYADYGEASEADDFPRDPFLNETERSRRAAAAVAEPEEGGAPFGDWPPTMGGGASAAGETPTGGGGGTTASTGGDAHAPLASTGEPRAGEARPAAAAAAAAAPQKEEEMVVCGPLLPGAARPQPAGRTASTGSTTAATAERGIVIGRRR